MDGRVRRLDRDAVRGILQRGGTILGTSRRDPYVQRGAASVRNTLSREWIDSLVVVGGDGTLEPPSGSPRRIPLVGVEKTIDNDIAGTDVTFGFDTAVQIATDALDRITTTAESHRPHHGGRGDGANPWLDRHVRGNRRAPTRCSCPRSLTTSSRSPPRARPRGGRPALLGGGGRRGRRAPPAPRSRPVDVFGFGWAVSRR